jgi:DNA-3-methyladenine glycosylase
VTESVPPGYTRPPRDFFSREVLEVAPDLLGGLLERTTVDGTIGMVVTEVEAYAGERDPGSHSYRGKTARNATMFGPPGHVYVFFTYGMHHAINLVAGEPDRPYGCLIRAGRIVEGEELARRRRAAGRRLSALADRDLARGPGNVAQAFGATLADDGADLFDGSWRFLIPDAPLTLPIATGPRVGVSGPAGDGAAFPWRFWIAGDPTVSAYRPAKPRRRSPG